MSVILEEPPLARLSIEPDEDEVSAFFRISDHHSVACIRFAGTDLAVQLRTEPPGNGRHVAVDRFVAYYVDLHESQWSSLQEQSLALISELRRIQQRAY
jgi:hypothetical protein